MKKRSLFLFICLSVIALAAGCKKKGSADKIKASDYVTLGEYKGIEVTVDRIQVTDGLVDMMIQNRLESNAPVEEVTDRAVMDGDIVNIDYEGFKDGVAFDGGSAKGVDLKIGSGQFIPGFEEGLIGTNIGDTVSLNLTFPEVYENNPDLAGQAVVFKVTVNSISISKIPELTEDYVKENTEYDSIQAYKDATRQKLQEISDEQYESDLKNAVIGKLIEISTFSSIPQSLLDYYAGIYRNYIEKQVQSSYGMSLSDYLAKSQMSSEKFEELVSNVAESQAKVELVERAVADAEKITISEDEYNELLPEYLSDLGISSEENLRSNETKEQTIEYMRMRKALDFVISNAVVNENLIDYSALSEDAADDTVTEEARDGADNTNGE